MKKAICILLALLLFTSTLAGCGREPAAETTAATTAFETTAEETTTAPETTTAVPVLTDEQILALSASEFHGYISNTDTVDRTDHAYKDIKAELTARQFLTYIKNNKFEDIIAFLMRIPSDSGASFDQSAYSFLNDVVVDSFTMSTIYSTDNDFKVTLNISKSSSKILPVGTSRWLLSITDDAEVYAFRRANDTSTILSWTTSRDLPDFCYDVTFFLTRFRTMNNFNILVTDAQKAGEISDFFYVKLMILLRYNIQSEGNYLKRTEVEAQAKKTFGITNVDFTKCASYQSADDTLPVGASGYGHIPATLASVTSNGRIRTVVIDYYSDDAYFLKAKTMEYVVRINDDDSLTLLSTRLVYDSGFPVYEFVM